MSITLSPGTAIVDINVDTGRLYLHLLHADAAPQVTKHVERLAELACRSFPTADLGTDSPSDPATDPASHPVAVPNSGPLVDGEDTAT